MTLIHEQGQDEKDMAIHFALSFVSTMTHVFILQRASCETSQRCMVPIEGGSRPPLDHLALNQP